MPITPETLVRHELNGLCVRVVEATNPDLVGIEGRVVGETTHTLRIEVDGVKTVPKAGATLEFRLPDGGERTSGSRSSSDRRSDVEYAVVEGDRLVARPARRTETAGGSTWHSD